MVHRSAASEPLPDELVSTPSTSNDRPSSRSGFRARVSRLDREKLDTERPEFSGFFNLFLAGMLYYFLVTIYHNIRAGHLLELSLLQLMSKDLWAVAIADGLLVLYSFTSFFLVKLYVWGLPQPATVLLQHVLQGGLIALATFFVYERDWPWPQSGSLMLHSIVIYMKMHSYARTNQELRAEAHPLFPGNVTLANFVHYLLVPTLVYEPVYPRTDTIRPGFLLEKAAGCVGALTLLYIDVTHYMYPVLARMADYTIFESIVLLVFPFMLAYLLLFYLVFECITNFMAEVTYFADREFYMDWWNSTNFDEFSRKWNKPVHDWLLRHVYLESIKTYRFSKNNATAATFFFSLVLHELALTVAGRRFRPYIFVMAMLQLVVIPLLRHPLFKGSRLGNIFFWLAILWGLPMLCVLYAREHYHLPPPDIGVVAFFFVVCASFMTFAGLARLAFNRRRRHQHVAKDEAPIAAAAAAEAVAAPAENQPSEPAAAAPAIVEDEHAEPTHEAEGRRAALRPRRSPKTPSEEDRHAAATPRGKRTPAK